MKASSGTVAHEQLSTSFKMWMKKLFSGFLISIILWLLLLALLHSRQAGKLENTYIPQLIKYKDGLCLVTFEGSGIFDQIPEKGTPFEGQKSIIQYGDYRIICHEDSKFQEMVKFSKKLPQSTIDRVFSYWGMIGKYFLILLFGEDDPNPKEKPKEVDFAGKKVSFDLKEMLFRGKKFEPEPELEKFFRERSVTNKEYIRVLDIALFNKVSSTRGTFNFFRWLRNSLSVLMM